MKKLVFSILFLFIFFFVSSGNVFADTVCVKIDACGTDAGCKAGEVCQKDEVYQWGVCTTNYQKCPLPASSCSTSSDQSCQNKKVGDSCGTNNYCLPQDITENLSIITNEQTCSCTFVSPSTSNTNSTTTSSVTSTITPAPTLAPIESTGQPCSSTGKNTVYPPNSSCYAEVKQVESAIDQYPLTCIPAPKASYEKSITIFDSPPSEITVTATANLSEATLGFLGPSASILSSANPDKIAQSYLFNGLFDRPSYSKSNTSREFFRTYWRMLSSLAQANVKAIYLSSANTNNTKLTYYYLDSNNNQQETDTQTLYFQLPSCLRQYPVCDDYVKKYQSLSQEIKTKYDTLLPFDFNNSRGYLTVNGNVSSESIPYLRAIVNAIQGSYGLFSFYTPSSFIKSPAINSTISSSSESTLYSSVSSRELLATCIVPSKTSSQTSPQTYPNGSSLSQSITIPLNSEFVSSTPDRCECDGVTKGCLKRHCFYYSKDQTGCEARANLGCTFVEGTSTYKLIGEATGKNITVLNNPLINTLNEQIVGTGQPGEDSFYRLFTPSYAPAVEKTTVSAPSSKTSTDDPDTTISNGNSPIYRENNLAQNAMHLLQNCWLVPSDQQSSSKCGGAVPQVSGECTISEEPLTGSCSKGSFTKYANGYLSGGFGATLDPFIPLVTPELSAVYAEAEKQTGVSCVILAAVHFLEANNNPCGSLISGRKIGVPEPDNGGKVYSTLLETAIDAGYEIAQKGATGASFKDIITAFSNYNGGGNSNCRIDWGLHPDISPQYLYCPAAFIGEDDPYATNKLGQKHSTMYLRCQKDYDCSSAVLFNRPGAFTVALNYYQSLP
ncbi:MAG TPA: hypothetical protein PLI45_03340 [Candidatus Woesebacteria bacterium]|nr:hypothetical protein [Candidatus Woesebacteria bacterium]